MPYECKDIVANPFAVALLSTLASTLILLFVIVRLQGATDGERRNMNVSLSLCRGGDFCSSLLERQYFPGYMPLRVLCDIFWELNPLSSRIDTFALLRTNSPLVCTI